MPHINQMKNSNFLKQDDCAKPLLVTIKGCHEENVAKEGAQPEMKWCLAFHEQEKPLVLNGTNAQIIASILGSENTDDWTGHKIVLYRDPTVQFQGKLVGGIRVRAPRNQAPAAPPMAGRPAAPASARRPAPPPPVQTEQPPEDYGDAYEGEQDIPY